jgi:NAD(P)-dependent dehydrogenase (short-subunit alcohol dehydrogenase family)
MAKQKKGVIVNISSIYGMSGVDQRIYSTSKLNSPVSYAASKGGIINLTRYLAAYWQKKNVRVNTLNLEVFKIILIKLNNLLKNIQKKQFLEEWQTIMSLMQHYYSYHQMLHHI